MPALTSLSCPRLFVCSAASACLCAVTTPCSRQRASLLTGRESTPSSRRTSREKAPIARLLPGVEDHVKEGKKRLREAAARWAEQPESFRLKPNSKRDIMMQCGVPAHLRSSFDRVLGGLQIDAIRDAQKLEEAEAKAERRKKKHRVGEVAPPPPPTPQNPRADDVPRTPVAAQAYTALKQNDLSDSPRSVFKATVVTSRRTSVEKARAAVHEELKALGKSTKGLPSAEKVRKAREQYQHGYIGWDTPTNSIDVPSSCARPTRRTRLKEKTCACLVCSRRLGPRPKEPAWSTTSQVSMCLLLTAGRTTPAECQKKVRDDSSCSLHSILS